MSQCEGKIMFKSKKNGEMALRKISKTGKIVPTDAHVYKCLLCTGWHLGHGSKYNGGKYGLPHVV